MTPRNLISAYIVGALLWVACATYPQLSPGAADALACTAEAVTPALEAEAFDRLKSADWQVQLSTWLSAAGRGARCALQRVANRSHQAAPAPVVRPVVIPEPDCLGAERGCAERRARWFLQGGERGR